jgi:hypothetical protein
VAKPEKGDETDRILNVLKHHLRRHIICYAVIQGEPVSPVSTSRGLDEGLPDVTYHFKVLREAGLFTLKSTRLVHGAVEHFYQPEPNALKHPIVVAVLEEGGACPR